MSRIDVYYIVCLLIISPVSQANKIQLKLEGLNENLQENILEKLSTIDTDQIILDGNFLMRIKKIMKEGLYALGYYESKIDFENRPAFAHDHNGKPALVVHISLGKPIRIAGSTIILRGDACNDPDYRRQIEEGRPKNGTILDHRKYDNFKSEFISLALRNGYFDGKFKKSQLGVSVERHEAFWNIDYDSGKRYRFSSIVFEGSQIRDAYLQNLAPFKRGYYYSSRELAEFNRRLSATGWFSSAVLVPEFKKSKLNKIISLRGIVSPRKGNSIEIGVGYATDVGPRLKAIWRKPWVNSIGHSLSTSAYVSIPEQQLDFSYKVPLIKSPLEQYYLLQGAFKHTNMNDIKSDSSTLTLSRYWDNSSIWQKEINLRWSLNHFTQTNVTNISMLLYPGISVNRTRSRGGLMPTWGDSQRYSINISDTIWGSDINFLMLQAQNVWIRTLADRHRFVIRSHLGWIETNNLEKVPPEMRYFTSKNHSIRGYKYKGTSQCNNHSKLIGASKLATGSVEYQYNVTGKWWGAVFIDSRKSINDIKKNNPTTSAGIGIRWQSPIGPIKLDFVYPISDKDEHGLQFYIGLGPEL